MKKQEENSITVNRQAFHEYEVLEKFEAGIVLSGPEVKAVRLGDVNLKSSYAAVHGTEVLVKNLHISPYKPAQEMQKGYDPMRERKLLLQRKEIIYLDKKMHTAALTLVPLGLHFKKGRIKVSLGLCRGKKLFDKRQDLKRKSQDMEIQRALK